METKVVGGRWDNIWYGLLCVATLGGAWMMRVIISQGIRYAFGKTIWNDE